MSSEEKLRTSENQLHSSKNRLHSGENQLRSSENQRQSNGALRPNADAPRLSAHALGILESGCPREFALRYKAVRYWPAADGPAARARETEGAAPDPADARLGTAFHLLAQQHSLGLDVTPFVAALAGELPKLPGVWARFRDSEHATPGAGATVWTEQALHFEVAGVPVMVRFDRVVREGDRWTVLDWKTGRPQAKRLQTGWQARLYPYALVVAGRALPGGGTVRPSDVRVVFWEVERGTAIDVPYDEARHAEVHRALLEMAARASAPFHPELDDDPAFPRKPRRCPTCSYHDHCNRRFEAPVAPSAPAPPAFAADRAWLDSRPAGASS